VALYRGEHLAVLVETFARWGLVDATGWSPVWIEHLPVDVTQASEGPPQIQARVTATAASVAPQGVQAWVRSPGGVWISQPLVPQGQDMYAATVPLSAGEHVDLEYFIEARDVLGHVARLPAAAPQTTLSIAIGRIADRFELESGWTAGAPGDAATTGRWIRAIPVGTSAQPAVDHTAHGTVCFVTGNAAPGAPASEADVDGGATTLLSPVWDLEGAPIATLSYWRWFSNDQGTAPHEDLWSVDVSNDGGATWRTLESTRVSGGGWQRPVFELGALFGTLGRVRLRFVARDEGSASLVEAAVDDVLLQVRSPSDVAAETLPRASGVLAASPNPCNPDTALRFHLLATSHVRLAVYDARGRLVRELLRGPLPSGPHVVRWDGRDARGHGVSSGTYLATLVTDLGSSSIKLAVMH
jgi:hypothetical protein